jgi:hypothetical protein
VDLRPRPQHPAKVCLPRHRVTFAAVRSHLLRLAVEGGSDNGRERHTNRGDEPEGGAVRGGAHQSSGLAATRN